MHRFLPLLFCAAASPLWAWPTGVAHVPLPADLSGTLNGVEYVIRVPANWNGTLLVYAHGSSSGAVAAVPPTSPGELGLEEELLSRGYALAGSLYEDSPEQASRQTLKLTRFFQSRIGRPDRTILLGVSLGGFAALDLIEKHPCTYDGAIAAAPVEAGGARDADFILRFDVAYAAAFGWPADWWGPIEDIRDDLYGNEGTLIIPVYQWLNETNYPQWEFIRLVMKLPPEAWWEVDPVVGLPGWALLGWKATSYRSYAELLSGGPVGQNVGTVYTLTADEIAYLETLGVDAAALLSSMNAHTNIVADRRARRTLDRNYSLSGNLRRPALTMHSRFDPILPPSHEVVYRDRVAALGREDELVQTYVSSIGHINFSAEQYLAALEAMEDWLDSGQRPDDSYFPESLGFDHDFDPGPWPY